MKDQVTLDTKKRKLTDEQIKQRERSFRMMQERKNRKHRKVKK